MPSLLFGSEVSILRDSSSKPGNPRMPGSRISNVPIDSPVKEGAKENGDSTPNRSLKRSIRKSDPEAETPIKSQSPAKWRSIESPVTEAARENGDSTPNRKRSIHQSDPENPIKAQSPAKWRSPRSHTVMEEDRDSTPNRKLSIHQSEPETPIKSQSPAKWRSPRRHTVNEENCTPNVPNGKLLSRLLLSSPKSPRKRLADRFSQNPKWNPRDPAQMQAVKEALHVATSPTNVVCREEEQKRVLDFCKACIEQEKAGSLYVCGCPGTGKTLSIQKVTEVLEVWSKEVGFQSPDALAINCTSLTNTSEIFRKMLEQFDPSKKISGKFSPLQHLQNFFSQKGQPNSRKMMLIIIDEMDYLITKDRAVLHDLFMLTTFPFSRFIVIGIANAIDLADRFLPKLESLNCKPTIVTFRAYSKNEILKILQERLMALGYNVFQPSALEFCSRKVAAASGDMRRALCVCRSFLCSSIVFRSAIDVLEAELRDATTTTHQEDDIVRLDHMDIALSKAFKSAVVDTIQSLPQHQQIILCSLLKLFRQCKRKATTIGELNKYYLEICKSTQFRAVGMLEFSSMCEVLSDQGLLKLGRSKEDRLKRVTLQVDSSDITFALKGIRFFQSCMG